MLEKWRPGVNRKQLEKNLENPAEKPGISPRVQVAFERLKVLRSARDEGAEETEVRALEIEIYGLTNSMSNQERAEFVGLRDAPQDKQDQDLAA